MTKNESSEAMTKPADSRQAIPSPGDRVTTQSVCKHCGEKIKQCPAFGEWPDDRCKGFIHLSQLHYCQDGKHMAEPASTGEPEPPITEMYLCETERLFLKPNQLYRFVIHPTCVRCQELELIGAARPSGPSEAQHRSGLAAYGTTLKVLAEMDKQSAAPQPVSGDAPHPNQSWEYKASFEIARIKNSISTNHYDVLRIMNIFAEYRLKAGDAPTCSCKPKPLNGQHWTGCPEGKVEEAQRALVRWLEKWELIDNSDANVALRLAMDEIFDEKENADLLAILRPYFPPASQTLESIEAEELLAQYDEEHHDHLDGRPHQWQAWRDKVLRRLATPASTARTDALLEAAQIARDPKMWKKFTDRNKGIANITKAGMAIAEALEQLAAPGSVPQAPSSWTVDEVENFKQLTSEPHQPKPTEHLIRAMEGHRVLTFSMPMRLMAEMRSAITAGNVPKITELYYQMWPEELPQAEPPKEGE